MTASNASGSPAPDSGPKPEEQGARKIMNVKVKDQQENETVFKIKSTTKLGKVFKSYGERCSVDIRYVRFLFHGIRVQDTETPESLEMEDGAEIQAMIEQQGGAGSPAPHDSAGDAPEQGEEVPTHLNVKVVNQSQNEIFKIKMMTPLKKVMDAYCQRQGIRREAVRFLIESERIVDTDTPASKEIVDGDIIEVFREQLGGGDNGLGAAGGGGGAAANGEDKPVNEGAAKHITLKVVDQNHNETTYKVKNTTKMEKVMNAYAGSQGRDAESMRFFTSDGTRVQKFHTPAFLDLDDEDVIDAHLFQEGGDGGGEDGPAGEGSAPANEGAKTHITITVKDDNGHEMSFKVKPTTSMAKLMDAYCGQQGRAPGSLRFFTPDGKRITKTDTPTTLRLEDSDLIDAHEEQLGGSTDKRGDEQGTHMFQFKGTPRPQHVMLKVKNTFTFAVENYLEVKYGRKQLMALLITKCCIRFCRHRDSVYFVVNDRRITDFDTAESLGLKDGSLILVYEENTVPWPSEDQLSTEAQAGSPPRKDLLSDDENDSLKTIEIKVRSCRRGDYACFNVLPSFQMKVLMHVYCRHVGDPLGEVSFWTNDKCRIYPHEKVKDYDLKDGDTIFAYEIEDNNTKIPKREFGPRRVVSFSVKDCFGKEVFVNIKRADTMKRVFDFYTKKMDLDYGNFGPIEFFTVDGKPISPTDTPITLRLDDCDIILSTFSHIAKLEYSFQKALKVSAAAA